MDKTRNYFIEEIKRNELISKKHKKVGKILNYTEHLLIVVSAVTGCVSIFALVSLAGIPVGIVSFAITIKMSEITARIKKYKSIIKEKKKKHDKIICLAKTKLNTTEIVTSKALIDSNISHNA